MTSPPSGPGHPRLRLTTWEALFIMLLLGTAAAAILLEASSGQIAWPPFLAGLFLLALVLLRPLRKHSTADRTWLDALVLVVVIAATHLIVWASGGGESALYAFYFLPILASAREYGLRGSITAGLVVSALYATFFVHGTMAEIEAELFEEIITLLFTSLLAGYLFEQIASEQEARRTAGEARRLADIGLLAAQVAHEIRNPLQVIEGGAETIDARGWIAPEGRPFLDDLRREARRMARIAGDFLAWGRPSIRVGESLPFRTLCDRALHRAGTPLVLALEGDVDRHVTVDADAIERALSNLLQNAAQAGATRVTIEAVAHPHALEATIADDGSGIPDALDAGLFEPFRSGRPGGSGLGLAIVRGIFAGHGGSITLARRVPAAFRILLPDAHPSGGSTP